MCLGGLSSVPAVVAIVVVILGKRSLIVCVRLGNNASVQAGEKGDLTNDENSRLEASFIEVYNGKVCASASVVRCSSKRYPVLPSASDSASARTTVH